MLLFPFMCCILYYIYFIILVVILYVIRFRIKFSYCYISFWLYIFMLVYVMSLWCLWSVCARFTTRVYSIRLYIFCHLR